jgi:cell fate (sporulation/competence/biofilm development) regulator YmcA (YheA/YmcA/DUF963 family)
MKKKEIDLIKMRLQRYKLFKKCKIWNNLLEVFFDVSKLNIFKLFMTTMNPNIVLYNMFYLYMLLRKLELLIAYSCSKLFKFFLINIDDMLYEFQKRLYKEREHKTLINIILILIKRTRHLIVLQFSYQLYINKLKRQNKLKNKQYNLKDYRKFSFYYKKRELALTRMDSAIDDVQREINKPILKKQYGNLFKKHKNYSNFFKIGSEKTRRINSIKL